MPEISLIISCYNQEAYIAECLDSVLAQSFTDFEAIVINDGSKDNSLSIIEQYAQNDARIIVISQCNQGIVAVRNRGLNEARGRYVYPLDGDDKIHPQCLALHYQAMIEGKGDVIYSEVDYFGAKTSRFILPLPTKHNMIRNNCVVCSALYNRSDALAYGGYDEQCKNGLEDWVFWCSFIFDNKRFYRLPEALFFYRLHDTTSRNNTIKEQDTQRIRTYICKKLAIPLRIKLWSWIQNFLYTKKITRSGKLIIKVAKIPVYYKNCSPTHPKA